MVDTANLTGAPPESTMQEKQQGSKIVTHSKGKHIHYGICPNLSLAATDFHLHLHDREGNPLHQEATVPFETLKALFFVKSYTGDYDSNHQYRLPSAGDKEIAVVFTDGEEMLASPLSPAWRENAVFALIPSEQETNNLVVVAVRSSISKILDGEAHRRKQQQEFNSWAKAHFKPGLSHEECMGDYYFSRQDYARAYRQYKLAHDLNRGDGRLLRKLGLTKYNTAIRCIKQKDFLQALRHMEEAHAADPSHADAARKMEQLRERLRLQQDLAPNHSSALPQLEEAQMHRFLDCNWIENRHHFILTGPAGSGKTKLACTLGHKASKKGFRVAYHRLPRLLMDIASARTGGTLIDLMTTLEKVDLLILDDWTSANNGAEEHRVIRDVLIARYKRRSTLIIAEVPREKWQHIFGEHTAADPVLNKVLHDAHKISVSDAPRET